MRNSFFRQLEKIARDDSKVYLLTADLGFKLFDEFRSAVKDRFIDVGVAEADMIGIASGLALAGKKVYCYSIIPFLVMRAYEQIRMDVAYHNLNVTLVGVGGGFTYGLEGFSHYGIEDLALMRSMPNMNVVVPADLEEAVQLASISRDYEYPLYIRLGRSGDPSVHNKPFKFEIGKGMVLEEGRDIAIFALGNMVYQAQRACSMLKSSGISASVVNMHTLKPLDKELVLKFSKTHKAIFSVEEHSVTGGLGSAIAEVLSEIAYQGVFLRIGIPERLDLVIGDADFLRRRYALTAEGIVEIINRKIKGI